MGGFVGGFARVGGAGVFECLVCCGFVSGFLVLECECVWVGATGVCGCFW